MSETVGGRRIEAGLPVVPPPPVPPPRPEERPWSDADRELAKRAAASVTRPGEGAWLNAGTFSRYWDEVTAAVLDALAAAGWRDLSQVIGYQIDGRRYDPADVTIVYPGEPT